ncbi:MAG: hypothetical protein CM1200mP34_3080 [Verrucomicrobiales bacterium]|nr:MAG: hypothetical protein CM1200mP34_3080 [Verrucomicrobiales bacterium]
MNSIRILYAVALGWAALGQSGAIDKLAIERVPEAKPRNVVFILTDDHRYDAMGFMGHPFLKTPQLDSIASNGVHLRNAFVTTSLCSPSRASILTGLYTHKHRVIDNNRLVPEGTVFFPQHLKRPATRPRTSVSGTWAAAPTSPGPGFDHWVSFRGQGTYLPSRNGLNVNGKKVPQKGYITDELTDYGGGLAPQPQTGQAFFSSTSRTRRCTRSSRRPSGTRGRLRRRRSCRPSRRPTRPPKLRRQAALAEGSAQHFGTASTSPTTAVSTSRSFTRITARRFSRWTTVSARGLKTLKEMGVHDDTLVIYMGTTASCLASTD